MTTARRPIVVGYDGSPPARAAVTFAVEHARGAPILLVHATANSDDGVLDDVLLEGNDELADARWEALSVDGDPAEAILAVARETEAAQIVIGTRARGTLASSLLGSVSHRVLEHADRPVTVVPRA